MRKVHTLGVTLFCGLVAIACGGTATSDNPPGGGNDAGPDATNNNNPPIGSDGGDASMPSGDDDSGACVIDADILTLAPPDAAIDDAGASVGECLACAQTTCSSQLSACNADCSCNSGFTCFANCIGGIGNTLLTCVGSCFPGGISALESNPTELGVISCAGQSCTAQCGTASILGGGGGGKKDGGGGGNKDAGDDDGGDGG
jgi:hypothetical protein